MSLNWKEIDLILSELELPGCQIQKAAQSAFDVIGIRLHGQGRTRTLLVALSPGACRLHETSRPFPKTAKALRFAEFLDSRIVNGWIEEAVQLGDNRIVRLGVRRRQETGESRHYRIYIRLWSNAANVIVTDEEGLILDAMRRLPKRGETTGGRYRPETALPAAPPAAETAAPDERAEEGAGTEGRPAGTKAGGAERPEYRVRELPGNGSFNRRIDEWYAERGGRLSLESLREEAGKRCEGAIGRIAGSLEKLRAKEAEYENAERLKEYGDIVLANLASIRPGDPWLEAEDFHSGGRVRIALKWSLSPSVGETAAQAERYYERYRKAKNGLAGIRAEIRAGEEEIKKLEMTLASLLEETNPLALHRLLRGDGAGGREAEKDRKRPGLSFRRGDWLIIVGRDAAENDALLRRHVKGNDLWLHARDFPGSYVFIRHRPGKTVPLDILLDAGNLALFYSKGRNNGEGDLFYTPVKYLRRAKDGPKGLVLPTREKNLRIRTDEGRLRELEGCRVEK
ncbi:MAG: NFACT family protein [Treponema sp.]|jgi:predicted ribosome quality control (RQC) complex YloA/Tae2 family protein|nr:NFACT family protein [Treponema sp.]